MSGQGETITVWKCVEPGCDYWRDGHESTGIHMVYADRGPGKAHLLEAVPYVPAQPVLELVKAAQDLLDTPEPTALSLPDQEADWRAIRRRASAALSALEELLKEE